MLSVVFRLIMVFVVASMKLRAKETGDKYEDLIYTSMKSIVSLDELVTELSVQVAKLTTSLSVIKVEGERTKRELDHTKTKIVDIEDFGMIALEKKIEKLTSSLSLSKEEVSDLRKDVDNTETRVEDISTSVEDLITLVEETNTRIDNMPVAATLISGEGDTSGSGCVKVCAGTTGRTETKWINYSSDGIYTDVDISSCGFVKTPTITTSLEGSSSHWVADGTSAVYSASSTKFRTYIYKGGLRVDSAVKLKFNVEWIAVGYTC